MSFMANILSRVLTQSQTHTADSLCEAQVFYVNREELYETREEMWGANSDVVGSCSDQNES
jgi:hypothetical protein